MPPAVRNLLHAALLLVTLLLLLALVGWILAGPVGVAVTQVTGMLTLLIASRLSARLLLSRVGARPLDEAAAPTLHAILGEIARRAGIEAPRLHYMPSSLMLAFTTGRPGAAGIVLSKGMLRRLSLRELAGVLAHEVSHVASRDLPVMALADIATRMTRTLALLGIVVVVLNVPFVMMGEATVAWPLVLVLLAAPTLSLLLQLALSRAREYEADRRAAELTGDPLGLASALEKLEVHEAGLWERFSPRLYRVSEPSLLQTHPPNAERVRRLLALRSEELPTPPILPPALQDADLGMFGPLPPSRPPRWWTF